mgnify:FL=1
MQIQETRCRIVLSGETDSCFLVLNLVNGKNQFDTFNQLLPHSNARWFLTKFNVES